MKPEKSLKNRPPFSIHIPGDFKGANNLVDEYEDAEKLSDFALKRINKICDPKTPNLIPQVQDEDDQDADELNNRRFVEKDVYMFEKAHKINYCEYNYNINMKYQIQKLVREKAN